MRKKQTKKPILTTIENIYAQIVETGLIFDLKLMQNLPDEPKMHIYNLVLENTTQDTDGLPSKIKAGGYSFFSKELALLKCLIEGIERWSMTNYQKKHLTRSTFMQFKTLALDPTLYLTDDEIKHSLFYWVEGIDLSNSSKIMIPAQLVFYSYKSELNEPQLTELVSTGGAGGLDVIFPRLQGIYEVIEKDCFMTMYLTKHTPVKIDLPFLNNKSINYILEICNRYNLIIHTFEITNDLGVSSFLSIVEDKTGIGPKATFGLKSSLNSINAIIGSIEEAFHSRPWIRWELFHLDIKNNIESFGLIHTFTDRALYWQSLDWRKELSFILDQQTKRITYSVKKFSSLKDEYLFLNQLLRIKNVPLYGVDISPDFFHKADGYVFKVIAPTLQVMYFNEQKPFINTRRIQSVIDFWGLKNKAINLIPHPIL